MDTQGFKAKLMEFDALREDDAIKTGMLDRIHPKYAVEWPAQLDLSVRKALRDVGIEKLYQHQAEAIRKSLDGADVVLESPTASGKTLAFTAPMLDYLKRNRDSHALMIYPMKALAFDQREQIRKLCEPLSIESFPYDGDTPEDIREVLRSNPPRILLTNPEYLNMSFLGYREQWEGFLRSLKFIVIDEIHEYHGYFGGNMALSLRRFFLYLKRIGASPRVFLSTATCANPKEHAKNLTGRDVEVVSARNVLLPKRHFMLVNPDIPDFRYRDILRLRVENAALCVLAEGLQTLVFCPTKRFLEEAFRNCKRRAEERGLDPQRISAFHADLKSEDKQDIQQKIKARDISVVFTTNALELGLDIGGLDGIILAGFPPRLSSAWQQIGRAGRGSDKDAFVLFYAMNDPIDRFFVGNLDAFLNKPFDELVIDTSNEQLITNHLPSLVNETQGNLKESDKDILGDTFYEAAKKAGKPPKGKLRPQVVLGLKLRGGFGRAYKLKRGDEELGQISEMRRFREAYLGAVFTFFGQKFRVHSHEEDAVVLAEVEPHLKTEPGFYTPPPYENKILDGYGYGEIEIFYGSVNMSMNFTGYKLVDERGDREIERKDAVDAYNRNYLHAFWVYFPPSDGASAGIGALEHILRVGAMFVIPADRFDTSTYSSANEEPRAFYYENHPGGIGVAKKLFDVEVLKTALKKGREIAADCKCRLGCQNCIEPAKSYNISNGNIDKIRGIELATSLLEAIENGPDRIFRNGLMATVETGQRAL